MKKKFLLPALTVALSFATMSCNKTEKVSNNEATVETTQNGEAYTINTADSKIDWKGYKILKTESSSHIGTLKFKSGELTVHNGNLESGKFIVDMNSLTDVDLVDDADSKGKLEGHLKSADFFDVAKFPTAQYQITKVTPGQTGDYNTLLDGNLTIKNNTKSFQIKANVKTENGVTTVATEQKDINRQDFDVNFVSPVENGVLKDEISVQMYINANKK